MTTVDIVVTWEDGWVEVPLTGSVMMLVAKTDHGMLLRYGSGSTSSGILFKANTVVAVDESVWIKDVYEDGVTVVAVTQ